MGDLWVKLADAPAQSKALVPLKVGDHELVQNQMGTHPKRWDNRGVVMKEGGHDQYQVLIDGSTGLFKPYQPRQSGPPYQETAYTLKTFKVKSL